MELWRRINAASLEEARALLAVCCGSADWVRRMLAQRPFESENALLSVAREQWFALEPRDWLEAFSHHPMIGDRDSLRARLPTTGGLSAREQEGVTDAANHVLGALADGNREYEMKFGFIFIVCATGRRADEMLALLRARLRNDLATEIRIAAEEQARITAIRLTRPA